MVPSIHIPFVRSTSTLKTKFISIILVTMVFPQVLVKIITTSSGVVMKMVMATTMMLFTIETERHQQVQYFLLSPMIVMMTLIGQQEKTSIKQEWPHLKR